MGDLVILGTDTDAGKTTFALLWLAAHPQYAYWKPVETGPSDSAGVQRLAPGSLVLPPAQRFEAAVAPPLAARQQGTSVWSAAQLAAARPRPENLALLIETFGGPFSPLNDQELQIELIRRLDATALLVTSSQLGAIGRTLQAVAALKTAGIRPAAVVLIGAADDYALQALRDRPEAPPAFALSPPQEWTPAGVVQAAQSQRGVLDKIADIVRHKQAQPEPAAILERDRQSVWHPYTPLRDAAAPLPVVGAQDEFLLLADGRRIIDGISSWWTILHGHRHPVLMQALEEASRQIDHVLFAGATHPWAVELAELLLTTVSPPVATGGTRGRVFYSDNGSTAVEVALKIAYQHWRHRSEPQRTRFVGFEHGYHGDTFGAMAVSRDPVFFGQFEPLLFQADIVPLDPEALERQLREHADRTAAVIVEPLVQGAGGMRMHTPATLRELWTVAQRHGVLFIADEVMTGGGRTGTLWAHQQARIAPDLICAAKTLAGGVLPLAATLVAPHVVASFDTEDRHKTFFHGHSFTAHPLACAVAVANWKLLTAGQLPQPPVIEQFWRSALLPLRERSRVKDVRILGSIAAIEVDAPGGYLADVGRQMRATCLERGVLLRPLGSVLYAMPPWCASERSLAQIADAMSEAVAD